MNNPSNSHTFPSPAKSPHPHPLHKLSLHSSCILLEKTPPLSLPSSRPLPLLHVLLRRLRPRSHTPALSNPLLTQVLLPFPAIKVILPSSSLLQATPCLNPSFYCAIPFLFLRASFFYPYLLTAPSLLSAWSLCTSVILKKQSLPVEGLKPCL